ncbi:hypothetical protein BLOT_012703 [Blomia tropicalis]|nr:hypothetical protein BLOT_012703 [Blomia tropicalis]
MIILTKSIQEIDILVWDGPSIIKDHGQGLPIEELNGMELISRIHRCETLLPIALNQNPLEVDYLKDDISNMSLKLS